jgi:superfamily II DNA or RNA helicase
LLVRKQHLKIGVLAGQPIFDQLSEDKDRDAVVTGLNTGELDGVVMTEKVGSCGHNLIGANHIIFMGSSYSQAYESQAIGNSYKNICRLLWMTPD